MSNRVFAERLNQGLDEIGVPNLLNERIDVFAKLIDIPRFKAESILNGRMMAEDSLLAQIATELEVTPEWLLGKSE
jgi:hypothetical protein